MDCVSVRQMIDQETVDAAVAPHLETCAACAAVRRVAQATRASLVVQAPPELSARLLSLAAPRLHTRLDVALRQELVVHAPADLCSRLNHIALHGTPALTRRPWVIAVYVVTAVLLGVSLFVGMQVYGLALQELVASPWWHALAALPGQLLDQLYGYVPQARYLVTALASLQRALQWLLAGLLMWAVLEMRTPQRVQAPA